MPRMPAMYTKMSAEYNILWFVVDMYHRERYFLICGPKQIAVRRLDEPLTVRWGKESSQQFQVPIPVFARDLQRPEPG